jgi:hypothetical protein
MPFFILPGRWAEPTLSYLPPAEVYRGNPEERKAERRRKLAQARHRRREKNLGLNQGTLPFTAEETVANP